MAAAGHLRHRLRLRREIAPAHEERRAHAETIEEIEQPGNAFAISLRGSIPWGRQADAFVVNPEFVDIHLERAQRAFVRHMIGCARGFWMATNASPLLFSSRVSFQRRLISRRLYTLASQLEAGAIPSQSATNWSWVI